MSRPSEGGGSGPAKKPKKPGTYSTYSGQTGGQTTTTTNGNKDNKKPPADPYAQERARQDRKEAKARSDAAKKYRDQAKTLQNQIPALQRVLSTGFKAALDQRLRNADLIFRQQDSVLMDGYNKRLQSLKDLQSDNAKAQSDQSFMNLTNRGRERANAVSEAMLHGAGESDTLKSQMMSLRNWNANESEGNRAFYDGLRSTNNSLVDLNVDTKTGRVKLSSELNADKDALWTDFYNRKAESYTQLGNIYGQQADYLSSAIEMGGKDKKARDQKNTASKNAFNSAADMASSAWVNPGVDPAIMNWQGAGPIQGETNASNFANATTLETKKRPEGAALRKW